MKVTRRVLQPGETIIGGKGILVPYRPRHDGGTNAPTPAKPENPTTFSVDPNLDNLITRYGRSAYRFFNAQDYDVLNTLGVKVIEGQLPGSTYFEAELRIPIEEANARAEEAGIPIRFRLKGQRR